MYDSYKDFLDWSLVSKREGIEKQALRLNN